MKMGKQPFLPPKLPETQNMHVQRIIEREEDREKDEDIYNVMLHASSREVPGRNFGDGQITINQNVNYKTKTT